jgi:hypothetical protein
MGSEIDCRLPSYTCVSVMDPGAASRIITDARNFNDSKPDPTRYYDHDAELANVSSVYA